MDSNESQASVSDHVTTNGSDVTVQLLADHGQLGGQDDLSSINNSSDDVISEVDVFFSVYFSSSRFTTETVIATLSALINVIALATLVIGSRCCTHGYHSKTVYRCLFANLAVADCLSSVSMWLGNNIAYLFGQHLSTLDVCLSVIYLSAAFFISSAFCLAAMMTVLGFAVVQYFSICHPLQNMTIVNTKKVSNELYALLTAMYRSDKLPSYLPNNHLSSGVV